MNSAEKQTVLHCLKSMIDEEVCEECPLYGMTGTDHCEEDCVRLAINALEQELCDDMISRQAAIDLIESIETERLKGNVELIYAPAVKGLRALPPATLAEKKESCTDAISRQAVLERAINAPIAKIVTEDKVIYRKIIFADDVEKLPPVTPAEKVGQWIEHFDESGKWYECDQCHTDWGGSVNYCPQCGVKMGGEQNGSN